MTIHTKIKKKRLSESSRQWLQRQLNDPYVQQAKAQGYRSRAAFKLLEIEKKYKILKPGRTIVDLGAAPGGWSQVAQQKVGEKGCVVAVDLLEMPPIPHVHFIQGDFTQSDIQKTLLELTNNQPVDCVISDMAPSTCGIASVDHIRIMALLEEAYHFALPILVEGGCFIAKAFQGGTESNLLKELKKHFKQTAHFKPNSSRKESSEIYLIAKGFKGIEKT